MPADPPEVPDTPDPCDVSWDDFAAILQEPAKKVVGTKKQHKLQSFYTPDDETHIQHLLTIQSHCWRQVHVARGLEAEKELRRHLHEAKTAVRNFNQSCRNGWAEHIISELQDAIKIHDMGKFHSLLPKLGIHMHGRSQEGREHFALDEAKTHVEQTMANPLPVNPELFDTLPTIPTEEWLGCVPTCVEIQDALSALRECAPGDDQITTLMTHAS